MTPNKPDNLNSSLVERSEPGKILTSNRVMIGAILAPALLIGVSAALETIGTSVTKLSPEEISKIEGTKKEIVGIKNLADEHGGNFYSMKRVPGMPETVKGMVYVNIPEDADTDRLIVYFHGGGGQVFKDVNITNIIQCAKSLKAPLIAAQDMRAGGKKRKDGLSSRWDDFDDPKTLTALVDFVGSLAGERAKKIELHTHSNGNVALSKILPDMEDQISRVVLYDSEDGSSVKTIGHWMNENSDAELFGYNNTVKPGLRGLVYSGARIYESGSNTLKAELEKLGISKSRYTIEPLPKNLNGQHAVIESMCVKYGKE